jgi:hypothetical protein
VLRDEGAGLSAPPVEAQLSAFLGGLDPAQLARLARRYQTLAQEDGAYVMLADGAEVAIPPILTPVMLEPAARRALARDAQLLVRALSRVVRDLIERGDPATQALLFAPLSANERETMAQTYRQAERLATVRVDFLVGSDGVARALEVNATIPAMQGYSDAIAAAFLRALGVQRGLRTVQIEAAVDLNGRNADDLLASLLAMHGGAPRPRSIAIVARPGDAQGGELDHYVRRWRTLGHDVWRVTPDQIERGHSGVIAAGRPADLLYRHVFLRRIDETSALAAMLREPAQFPIWNPPASQYELKAMLALLSATERDDAAAARIGLAAEERGAVARRLPWTRLCLHAPAIGPDGGDVPDLLAFARAHQDSLVLKRSWDYGGRGVFLGAEMDDASSQARLRALLDAPSDRTLGWGELLDHIERSGEAWVMQSLVDVQPRSLLRVDATGPERRSLYADLSAFTSLGNDVAFEGGAVRASGGRIVNIQGGGGLAPLLRAEALERVLAPAV